MTRVVTAGEPVVFQFFWTNPFGETPLAAFAAQVQPALPFAVVRAADERFTVTVDSTGASGFLTVTGTGTRYDGAVLHDRQLARVAGGSPSTALDPVTGTLGAGLHGDLAPTTTHLEHRYVA